MRAEISSPHQLCVATKESEIHSANSYVPTLAQFLFMVDRDLMQTIPGRLSSSTHLV